MSGTQTEFQSDQLVNEAALPVLNSAARAQLSTLLPAIDKNLGIPFRLFATATPNSSLNIASNIITQADGSSKAAPAVNSTIPTFAASTIDFQAGTTTGGTISITFPVSTVGRFRRMALSFNGTQINTAFSAEVVSVGSLADPGTLLPTSEAPIGWIDLECTAASPARFKTAGSATAIIENSVGGTSRIVTGSGSATTSASSVVTGTLQTQQLVDNTTTGTATTLNAATKSYVLLTNASLISLAMIPAGSNGQVLTLTNNTGVTISLKDESGATAANRIRTGSGADVQVNNNASVQLIYDSTNSRWRLEGTTTALTSSVTPLVNANTAVIGTSSEAARADHVHPDPVFDAGNSGTLITVNWNNGKHQKVTLTGNATIELSNPSNKNVYYLWLKQDSTGGRAPFFPGYVRFVNGTGPTSQTANRSSLIKLFYDGLNYLADTLGFYDETPAISLSSGGMVDPLTNYAWIWGGSFNGRLGRNSGETGNSPTSVPNIAFSKIAAPNPDDASGANNTVGGIDLRTGMVWTWGLGANGALGNNTTTDVSSPVTIARSASYSAIAMTDGVDGPSAVIDAATGNIWTWGPASGGGLGNNNIVDTSSPVAIARTASYTSVSMGLSSFGNGAAIDAATGNIWVWGNNNNGALGNNSLTSISSPVTIARSASYSSVSMSVNSFGAAIDAATGNIWVWGNNGGGQLGNNSTTTVSSPVTIARSASYSAVSCGNGIMAAIDAATGNVWVWGSGPIGKLGNNTSTSVSSPVTIARSASYIRISCGTNQAFALDSTGIVWAWGARGNIGSLGDGIGNFQMTPITIARSASYAQIALGYCRAAIDAATGNIWTWGDNSSSALGNNTTTTVSSPVTIARSASYSSVYTGVSWGSAIDAATGNIWTWGTNTSGVLGNNSTTNVSSPVTIARSASYSKLAAGTNVMAAVDAATGNVWVWGSGANGGLGNNSIANASSPVTIARSASYSNVFISQNCGAVIDAATGNIWTWGVGSLGRLGNNSTTNGSSPVTIARSTSYSMVTMGNAVGAAIDSATGNIWVWGSGTNGLLGNNTITTISSPVTIARSASYSAVCIMGTSGNSAAAIDAATGNIWVWGQNSSGQLGNNSTVDVSSPVTIARSASYSSIAAGAGTLYAIDALTGAVWAWGSATASSGSLGDNKNHAAASSPVSVGKVFNNPLASS